MRTSPLLPVLLAVSLASTACGARLDEDTRRAAVGTRESGQSATLPGAGGDLATTSGGAPVAGPAVGPAAGAGAGPAAGTGGTGSGGATGGGTTGAAAGSGGNAAAAPAPAGGNGGATDVGVTADAITVGNVSDLSGPVPGLFQGAVIGTQAYFAKVNAAGGVFGRKLKVRVGDGQLDCDQNRAQHRALKDRVFAFVGSWILTEIKNARFVRVATPRTYRCDGTFFVAKPS